MVVGPELDSGTPLPSRTIPLGRRPFLKRSGVLFTQATTGADAFQDGGERAGFCAACHQ